MEKKNNKLRILHISDTHSHHHLLNPRLLDLDGKIDLIIHSGDSTNYFDSYKNEVEFLDFIHWYGGLNIPNKILIAGNHDATCSLNKKLVKEWCNHYDIIYLENDYCTIDGFKIYGSPITPTFGSWYFMKALHKLDAMWKLVDEDVDIMITHGPCKGILDTAINRSGSYDLCGDKSLRNHILNRIKPKLHCFGHIHTNDLVINGGCVVDYNNIKFSNGSVVTDGKFGSLSSEGNYIILEK